MAQDHSKPVVARRRSQRRAPLRRSTVKRRTTTRTFRSESTPALGTRRSTRRLTEQGRASLRRLAALVAVIGLVAALAWLFLDERFYVSNADITGLRYSSASDVYRQAGIDGYSIFWVDKDDTAERIEALPYVKTATVQSSLPNRVRIAVDERTPVAVWKVDGRDYWVDVEGITMPVASPVDALPVLWDLDGSTVDPSGRVDGELIAAARTLKEQQPGVAEFGYDRVNGLQFRMPTGTVVHLGKPEGLAKRVRELAALQQSLASQGTTPAEINWRVEDGYYLR
jgi:cell division septal protein FtsQ